MNRRLFGLTIGSALLALALVACGAAAATPTRQSPTATTAAVTEEAQGEELQAIPATTVLRPGSQRVAFLLVSSQALVTAPQVSVTSFFQGESGELGEARESRTALFNEWPYGTRGSYSTELAFDREGSWVLDIRVGEGDFKGHARLPVEVLDGYGVIDVGQAAPASMNRTTAEVDDLAQLTSAYEPVPTLYETTIAEAISSGKPTLVVFATPAFCTSATCGPQVETVGELSDDYAGRANFIHVEVYDNPHEVQGDLSRGRVSPVVVEWGLTTVPHWSNESWVFLVGKDGLVKSRFEAYTSITELEEALLGEME